MTDRKDPASQAPEIMADAAALGDAMLAYDVDEARFLTHRIAVNAVVARLPDIAIAAEQLLTALGPAGTAPGTGYGTQLLALADALRRSGNIPLPPAS